MADPQGLKMTAAQAAAMARVLDQHRPRPGHPVNILRTLLAIEEALGYVPVQAIEPLADALGVPRAQIAGVLSYYPDLHTAPRGRHVVRVCLGEACVANQSARLLDELQRALGVGLGRTTEDGRMTLERVYCLGNCAVGPTIMIDDTIYGRMSASDVRQLLKPDSS